MILVVRIGRLGDFLTAIPAMQRLRTRFPSEKIVLLTGYSSLPSVLSKAKLYAPEDAPPWAKWVCPRFVDEVISTGTIFNLRSICRLRRRLSLSGKVRLTYVLNYYNDRLSSRVKKYLWLRLLGVHGHIYSAASSAKMQAGVSAQVQVPWEIAGLPDCSQQPLLPGQLPVLTVEPTAVEWARQVWKAHTDDTSGLKIVVNVGATHEHKRWAEENFVFLLKDLIIRKNARILIVGTSIDSLHAGRVVAALPDGRARSFCGMTSLDELAALIVQADLFVANDGGSAHLAAAVGTPCITIMSGVHAPGVWDPSGSHCVAIREAVPCQSCLCELHCPRGEAICITRIPVDRVVNAVDRLLTKRC